MWWARTCPEGVAGSPAEQTTLVELRARRTVAGLSCVQCGYLASWGRTGMCVGLVYELELDVWCLSVYVMPLQYVLKL